MKLRGKRKKLKIPVPLEHDEQLALIQWCNLKKIFIFAIPNGGKRNVITAQKLKAEGVVAGIPDLFIPEPRGGWHGIFIEMKRTNATPSATSPIQGQIIAALRGRNYKVKVCKGWIEASKEIEAYLKLKSVEHWEDV